MNREKLQPSTLISQYKALRAMTALMVAFLLLAGAQTNLNAQEGAPGYVELGAEQLDQLVAPIALYPDSLVGQVLTASTYPDQIGAADSWLNQNMGLPPDQRASAADSMPWDPAVKALTAFPSVLNNLAKNNAWTSQLGNAYYNQPGDVMNALQALRSQAHDSNKLVTTAQQRVVVEEGVISIVPVATEVVCVPYYNPWAIWGPMFVAYPGFVAIAPPPGIIVGGVGIAFFPGISIGIYGGFGWGFAAWEPVWGGGVVMFHHDTYISHSVTVVNHGHFGGHDRGAFEHGGRGVPAGYHATAHAGAARTAAANSHSRSGNGAGSAHAGTGSGTQARGNSSPHAGGAAQSRSSFSSHSNTGTQARSSFSSSRTNGGAQSRNNFSSHSNSGMQARSSFSSSRTNGGAQSRSSFSSHPAQARNNFSSHMGGGTQTRSSASSRMGGGMQARNNFSSGRMGGGGARMGGGGARMGGGGARMGGGGGRRR
jgi:hypothetical protein